jgi:hypothetical protein
MEQPQRYDSIIGRERNILGKVSFLPPVVFKDGADGAVAVSFSRRENTPKNRHE